VVEALTLAYAEGTWESTKERLRESIASDVRAELVFAAGEFRRNVIGAPGNQRGLVGRLATKARGDGAPTQNLGSLPRWAPRTANYLADKKILAGHQRWFDNTGWEPQGGTLADFFKPRTADTEGGGTVNIGSGGIFEEMFGGISVRIIRNNVGTAATAPTLKVGGGGVHTQTQLGRVEVRALGKLTNAMLGSSDRPNTALLDRVAESSAQGSIVALHLRGGRGRYRPALEPYLKFFLERALPFAVQQRIRKGTASGRLFRMSAPR